MKLKEVGALPNVSNKGVSFDHTQPDKYMYLNAAVELLEALSFGPTETTQHLYNTSGKIYNSTELLDLLKKHCTNLDEVFSSREDKTKAWIGELIDRVKENSVISEEGRKAWLNNIEMMRDYYMQYVTNESAYTCALGALSQEIHNAHIEEVAFPMFRNHGVVLHDLISVLEHRKAPIDADLSIEKKDDEIIGKLSIKHR